jgi:hypothetical protein
MLLRQFGLDSWSSPAGAAVGRQVYAQIVSSVIPGGKTGHFGPWVGLACSRRCLAARRRGDYSVSGFARSVKSMSFRRGLPLQPRAACVAGARNFEIHRGRSARRYSSQSDGPSGRTPAPPASLTSLRSSRSSLRRRAARVFPPVGSTGRTRRGENDRPSGTPDCGGGSVDWRW